MSIRRQVFLILLLLLFNTGLTAQQGNVQGIVIEKQNRIPVEFASVAILQAADSTIITGDLTEMNGTFFISKLAWGKYILKVVSIGYETFYKWIEVKEQNTTIKLDTVYLNIAVSLLEEVVVKGDKNTFTTKLEKQVFAADRFEIAKGGNATDVLKNLPSVSVNGAGEISVRGSSGFLVLINGKPVISDPQTILSQLPANSIENIELITAPSAKYDADGKAGIINITLKKGIADGVAMQLNLQGGLPSTTDYNNLEKPIRIGGDIILSLKKSKWDVSLNANYTRNDANGMRDGYVYTKNFKENIITRFPSSGERSFDRYNYGLRTSLSYSDKNTMFSAGFFASRRYQQRRADILYNNSTLDLANGALLREFSYFNSNLQNKEGSFVLGSMDYSYAFDNKSKFTTSLIYETVDLFGTTINSNLDYPALTTIYQIVTNPYTNPLKGYRFKMEYSTPIKKGNLETGFQYRQDKQNGKFDYTSFPAIPQRDIEKFSGTATSSNRIKSIYVQYSNSMPRLQYITGLRYETTMRNVSLSSDSELHKLNLKNLFPSANLLYTLTSSWNLKAGYSKRIQRNTNFELNPIPEREHSETLEQGDPDLLPQFIDLIELGINHSFTKGSFFSTLYYQYIKNPIQRVNSVYADTILNRLFTNAGRARLVGMELGTSLKPLKWLSTYFGANLYNYNIAGNLDVLGNQSIINNSRWVYSLNMNTSMVLGKDWNLQANVNYLSPRPTPQGIDSRFLSPNISIKKAFANGKYILGFQWQNLNMGFINSNQQRITTWAADFYTTTNYIYETDVLMLNFNLNLNKLNTKSKLPSSEFGEREF